MWYALPHTSDPVPRTSYLTLFAVAVQTCSRSSSKKKRGRSGQFQVGPAPILRSASYDLSAELGDVLGRGALLALHDVEFNALAFSQRLEAVALNGGMMNEAILLSVLGGDEAKALGVVEPLYFAGGTHVRYILIQLCRSAVFAVPVRLLFVRGRNGRIFCQETKKDLANSQVPLQFAGSDAQSLRFRV